MRATVNLELRHKETHKLLDQRSCSNAVMQGGASLIAALFTGQGSPITHLAVGTSGEPAPETFNLNQLNVDPAEISDVTEAAITPDSFTIDVDEQKRVVKVRVRTTLPEDAAIGRIREAGLLSRVSPAEAVLYNRITFDPINKGDDHELTLFWEVTFPYGDLQWF